jgi:hypothetical protein
MNIIFSNKISPYVEELGSLSMPLCDDGGYHLQVGDTVDLTCEFHGILINRGTVHAILEQDDELANLMANEDGLDQYSKKEIDLISKRFDHYEFDMEEFRRCYTPCVVVFNKSVSEHVLLDKFDLESIASGELKWKGMRAHVERKDSKFYTIKVHQTAFIGWRSVISTAEIDAYKLNCSRSSDVEGVAHSDDAIESELINKINGELDEICKKQTPDYHPGSGKVVRDIIHPSLYCYVKRPYKGVISGAQEENIDDTREDQNGIDFWGRQYNDSVYQWLPSEIDFSEDGRVGFLTYINNLDDSVYPGIKDSLTALLQTVAPMLELVCSSLRNDYEGGEKGEPKAIPLRGRRLQIITKVVEYTVNSEENFDGVWHVEGMSHEEIIATALCIIKRDNNFKGADIEFRRFLYREEADNLVYSSPNRGHKATDIMDGGDVRPLGSLETPDGRVIVFPNSHIHRLTNMYSDDGKPAVRRIVVFWLVNPDRRIISTQDIPRQQGVITIDEALRNRLALMAERKLHKQTFSEREVELCEH